MVAISHCRPNSPPPINGFKVIVHTSLELVTNTSEDVDASLSNLYECSETVKPRRDSNSLLTRMCIILILIHRIITGNFDNDRDNVLLLFVMPTSKNQNLFVMPSGA